MKRARGVRDLRRSRVAVGALMIGIPASAGLATAGQALAQTIAAPSDAALSTQVKARRIAYNHWVVLNGSAPASEVGHELELQFHPAGSSGEWTTVGSGTVTSGGRFHLAARLKRSGLVRVVDPSAGTAPSGSTTTSTTSTTTSSAGAATTGGVAATPAAGPASSGPTHAITVAARLSVQAGPVNDLGGQPVDIRGRLLPGLAGRKVSLQSPAGARWQTLVTARTGPGGYFDLHYVPSGAGSVRLRVRFGGDRANASASAPAGSLTAFHPSVASWYDDAGSTACGFHAYYGVANRTLPCGTQVTFFSGGRTVTATVDDRGPYVGGRDWDLNQNTARALGFDGVGTVWSSI